MLANLAIITFHAASFGVSLLLIANMNFSTGFKEGS